MGWTRKLTGPGLFRLLLASVVVLHHASRFAIGSTAVYGFFCLSGYWIHKMWCGRYSQTTHPYFTYLVSRFWRLIPTFLLIGVISLVVETLLGQSIQSLKGSASWTHFVLSQLFIFGYAWLPVQPVVPAWSLDIEMQFYLIAPLLVLVLSMSKRPVLILGIAGALSLGSALWIGHSALSSSLVFFVIGMVASEMNWRPSGRIVLASAVLGALFVVGLLLTPYRGALLIGAHPGPYAVYNQSLSVALGLLLAPLALYTTRQKGFVLDGMFADLSYIVYLLHWSGNEVLSQYQMFKIPRIALMGVVWTIVYVLAFFIWKVYDKPINRARSQWVSGREVARSLSVSSVAIPVQL